VSLIFYNFFYFLFLICFIFMRGLKMVNNIYYLCSRLSFEPKVFLLNFDSFFLNCWAQVLAQVFSLRCSILAESYSLLLGLVLSRRFFFSGCLFLFWLLLFLVLSPRFSFLFCSVLAEPFFYVIGLSFKPNFLYLSLVLSSSFSFSRFGFGNVVNNNAL